MGLKPIGERIVIKMIEEQEAKTSSGIVLPNSAKEKPEVAEVVAVSEEILNDDDTKDVIKVGDKVVYSKYAGTEVTIKDEEYIVVKLDDVLAIVE
ncbi:MAG: co-chaperone GroES [Gallicola sp.]|uniref:co-chaperone GroES n=1 Tax=Gallicola sp. Sow4_E12 TaxID=3438785 RepID=UPI0017DFAAF7|nr:co-chaperone GroES [Gallicola sp.]